MSHAKIRDNPQELYQSQQPSGKKVVFSSSLYIQPAMDRSMESSNFSTLRECLTAPIIRKATLSAQKSQKARTGVFSSDTTDTDASELSDFIDYLTSELWPLLPVRLQSADYNAFLKDAAIKELDSFNLKSVPPSFSESLIGYDLVVDDDDVEKLIVAVMEDYVDAVCAPPPVWVETRTEECEICERNVPLSYHHLIPVGFSWGRSTRGSRG